MKKKIPNKAIEIIDVEKLFPKDTKQESHIIHHHSYNFLKEKTNLNSLIKEKLPSFDTLINDLTDVKKVTELKKEFIDFLNEKKITIYYHLYELGRIWVLTSSEEIFVAYIIPAIIENYYLHLKKIQTNSEKIIFVNTILGGLCLLIEQITYEQSAQFSVFFSKFATELLSQNNDPNDLASIGYCELFFSNLLSLPEETLKLLEPQLIEQSYLLSKAPNKSEVITKFIKKYPALIRYQNHSFYYYLKQIENPQQQIDFLAAYDKCFDGKKVTYKPLLEWIIAEPQNIIYDFISATLENLDKTKDTDVKTKFKRDILILLIESGIYHEEFMSYTLTNPKIIKRIFDDNYSKIESIYQLFAKKNAAGAAEFLKASAIEYPSIKKWAEKKYPELFLPLKSQTKVFFKQKERPQCEVDNTFIQKEKSFEEKKAKKSIETKVELKPYKEPQHSEIKKTKTELPSNANYNPHKKPSKMESTFKQKVSSFANQIINTLPTLAKPFISSRPVIKEITYAKIATSSKVSPIPTETLESPTKQKNPAFFLSKEEKPILFGKTKSIEHSKIISFLKLHLDDKELILNESYTESKLSTLFFLLKEPSAPKALVEEFCSEFLSNFMTEVINHFKNKNLDPALDELTLLLLSEKMPFELTRSFHLYLFDEMSEKRILFLFGKFLEINFFPLIASIFYLLCSSVDSKQDYLMIKYKYLNAGIITDFLAINNINHIAIKNILAQDNYLYLIQTRILKSYQKNDISVIDCLEAFNNYLKMANNLFDSGWAAEKALSVFTCIFNSLVNLLMNIEILLPAIVQSENLGHSFCVNLSHLLRKTSIAEFFCRIHHYNDPAYLKSLNLYQQAFSNQIQRMGCFNPAPDTHFSAYYQLINVTNILSSEFIQKIIHLGKFEAIIFSADFFSPHDFCEKVIRPEVKHFETKTITR